MLKKKKRAGFKMATRLMLLRNETKRICSLYKAQSGHFNYKSTVSVVEDKVTHTGQSWSGDDYRMVRFIDGKEKEVNERWAINLIAEVPPKGVADRHVWCDGGDGPLGHPKVYINLDTGEPQSCGYCGLRYYQLH